MDRSADTHQWAFLAGEVCQLTGVPPGTLQNWLNRRVLKIADSERRGPHRVFGVLDVVTVQVTAALTALRVPPRVVDALSSQIHGYAVERLGTWAAARMPDAKPQEQPAGDEDTWPAGNRVFILYPDPDDADRWHVELAAWDREPEFDPSELPDSFVVLRVDNLADRLFDRMETLINNRLSRGAN